MINFISNILNTISNSEVFVIVMSGVLIFTLQQLISQLWIPPFVKFKECITDIESLMNRWDVLHRFTEGKNTSIDSHGKMDDRIKEYRIELNEIATRLVYRYNALSWISKIWYRFVRRFDFKKAKGALLTLSTTVSAKNDYASGKSKSSEEIEKIYSALKISKYLQS